MRKLLFVLAVSTPVAFQSIGPAVVAQAPQVASPLPSFAEPGISPDGSTIAFVSGGDIWEVPARGGDARLLVSHPATESRPLFSPDGKRLAFTSTRTGNGDVYVLTLTSGDVTRLTYDDANELVSGWSPDSQSVLFQSNSHEISGMLDVYRVGVDGGTPMPVAADRYTTEYFAAPSPGGESVAITARANAASQWWRKGHSHLDESEIWIVRPAAAGAGPRYEQITRGGAKDAWPMWAAGGKGLYLMSDRSGAQNIWAISSLGVQGDTQASAKAVTTFTDGRVLWPSITRDGRTIAFEREFGIWTVDTASGQSHEVPIALRGAPAATSVEHRTFSDQVQELALSPDGRKAAFTVHGEVFSISARDGGDAVRVTQTAGEESEISWAPDSRRLAYVSDRDGANHLFVYDFGTGKETQVTTGVGRDNVPRFSPDGKWVAFERNSKELRVIDPATREEKLLATGAFDTPPFLDARDFVWSPDSRYVAFLTAGTKTFQNVHVVAATGGEARAVSFLANANAGSLSWSPDGSYLTFATSQRTEPGEVMRVDLLPRTPKFREDQFRDLFREEHPKTTPAPSEPSPAAAAVPDASTTAVRGRPVEIVYDEIRRRATSLPAGVDVARQEISPDGKWLLLTASAAGQQNLYVFPIDELSKEPAVARQLTSTPGAKRSAHFTADSKEVYYLDRGRIFNVTLEKREPRAIAVAAELDVDFSREKVEAFRQAWTYLRDQFFDETMNGVDWNAVRKTYEPRVAGARTPDEMRRIVSLMLGELNASHMGISAPPQGNQNTMGRLAADFDGAEYDGQRTAEGRLGRAAWPGGARRLEGRRLHRAGGRTCRGRSRQPRCAPGSHDRQADRAVGRRVAIGGGARADRQADRSADGEGAALPRVGGAAA